MELSKLVGRQGRAEWKVTDADTAIALGSGDVPVLATPRLIALLEAATCAALDGQLQGDQTSVGTRVDVAHRRPTPRGARVDARATVISVDETRIMFDVTADHQESSGHRVEAICRGTITRVVVDRSSFEL